MKTSTPCLSISDTSSSITASAERSTSITPEASMMTALTLCESKIGGWVSQSVSRSNQPVSQSRSHTPTATHADLLDPATQLHKRGIELLAEGAHVAEEEVGAQAQHLSVG